MTIRGIDHINIGTHRLAETCAFFRDVLGLTEGWRPNVAVAGAWLYAGETAIVHLVELAEPKRPSSEAALDHFAFSIDDFDDVVRRLDAAGVSYRTFGFADTPIRQILVCDLNGVNIELNYRAPAKAAAAAKAAPVTAAS
jgi:catechol 2,3-dioxygenase-like lactoylglutathione lyase family enzyme